MGGNTAKQAWPICTLDTNIAGSDLGDNFPAEFMEKAAEILDHTAREVSSDFREEPDPCE